MTVGAIGRQSKHVALRRSFRARWIRRREGRFFPKQLYKLRARIEQTMGKLKRFKRIALRCDKTAICYVALTSCSLMLIKSVHTT